MPILRPNDMLPFPLHSEEKMRSYTNLVLTVPLQEDRSTRELTALIRSSSAPVYISRVAGFGRPELRIGPGEYVRGARKIKLIIEKKLG